VYDVGEAPAGLGEQIEHRLEGGDDREAREHLQRAAPFVEVVELARLGAHSERVENDVLPAVRVTLRLALFSDDRQVEGHARFLTMVRALPRIE